MKENVLPSVSSVITILSGIVSENIIVQWIMIILGFLSFIVSITYTLYKWYKTVKQDGKITIDEIGDLLGELDRIELPKEIQDKIEEIEKKGKE